MNKMLIQIAQTGRIVCDTFETRKLWYAGLVQWCSPTEVCLTSAGLSVLYRAEENGEI
jgi:hypothetical protein